MKKKIFLSLFTVIAICVMIGAGTFAIFTSEASNNSQTISAGNLGLGSYRDAYDTAPGPMFYTTAEEGQTTGANVVPGLKATGFWAPGDSFVRSLVLYNDGNLDLGVDKIKAVIRSEDTTLASKVFLQIFRIGNQREVEQIASDDALEQVQLDSVSDFFNMEFSNGPIDYDSEHGLMQDNIQLALENRLPNLTATKVWSGYLDELTTDYVNFEQITRINTYNYPFAGVNHEKGAYFAFVATLDKDQTGNESKGKSIIFDFLIKGSQIANQ